MQHEADPKQRGLPLACGSGGSSGGLWKISGALRGQGPLPEHRCGGCLLWSLLITLWSQPIYLPATQGDEHRLSDYAIGPESKLNLVIKPPEKASPEETGCKGSPPATAFPTLWPQLTQVLARHFSTADMEKVLEQLQKDYDRSLRLLSLDDIERLATRILHPDTPDMLEMGFLD
ncbi:ubiquitin-like protein 4A [Alligator sinensis]|uniref:Ubiquitin-like protein 4A n=1 Tax=Alligator sinensis TaxID=38654 RepID=A0A3Q0H833_ALLSI|nr:ubiquitin-like protein 4A [Alligator sinensis]